ncbi:MAG: flagellar hook basal-body protein [Gemmobacter sp.]
MIPIIRTGMASASKDMAVISHNIANGATNGFKRSNAQFEDAYPTGLPGNVVPGMGSRDVAPRRSHAPGAIRTTGQVLDMAVLGQGMFVLGPASGEGRASFTRNGSFQIDQQGFITTPIGQPVLSTVGLPIRVPTAVTSEGGTTAELSALSIDASGVVTGNYGLLGTQTLGRLAMARFVNEPGLTALGDTVFGESEASGAARIGAAGEPGFGTIQSGALEMSNADMTTDLTSLIRAQQAFAANSRMLQAAVDIERKLSE